jgi:hypothetical protein
MSTGLKSKYSTESLFLDLLRSQESIPSLAGLYDNPPGYIGWRNRIDSSESILGLNKRLQIRALYSVHLLAVAKKMNIVPFKGRHCPGKVVTHHHKSHIFKPKRVGVHFFLSI